MEWWLVLFIFFGALIALMMTGLPIAICFYLVNLVALLIILPGTLGLVHFIRGIFDSIATFTLMPLLLFILMGNVLFHSGIGLNLIDTVDKLMGRLPGRLALVAVGAGTLFAFLTGAAMGSTGILGSTLTPEMERRGYKRSMSMGPIVGSGGLAPLIPPSGLAILLGAIGSISIAGILMAIIVPGFIMAGLFAVYIIIRCWLDPSIAPAYEVAHISLKEKVGALVKYVLPIGFVVFMVLGVIILGIATPSEAAATGTLAMFILAAAYRKLSWTMTKKSLYATLETSVMILMIIGGARAFTEVLAFTGASRGLINFTIALPIAPILIVIAISILLLIVGMFMSPIPVMIFALPLLVPVMRVFGFNTVWFGVLFMIIVVIGEATPPFGYSLFVMKGVGPKDATMGELYRAVTPFIIIELVLLALVTAFPILTLWLPQLVLK